MRRAPPAGRASRRVPVTAAGGEESDAPPGRGSRRLLAVVGYDGSEASRGAVDAAVQLLTDRLGTMEVVFVGQYPLGAEMAPQSRGEVLRGFDLAASEYEQEVRRQLEGVEARWHFRQREGQVAHELVAVAEELSRDYGGEATVVIVVGSARQAYHRVVGSVPVALVRRAKYPVVVVP